MPDYTVTLTAPQETALTRIKAYIDELRAMEDPPLGPASKAAIVQKVAIDELTLLLRRAKEWDRNKLIESLTEATPAQITQIRTILGI